MYESNCVAAKLARFEGVTRVIRGAKGIRAINGVKIYHCSMLYMRTWEYTFYSNVASGSEEDA